MAQRFWMVKSLFYHYSQAVTLLTFCLNKSRARDMTSWILLIIAVGIPESAYVMALALKIELF